MTKIYVVVFALLILIGFSCKKETPTRSFELSATTKNNNVFLNWSPVLLSGFKSINVYRSTSPIPDPQFDRPIDANLLIATISDKNKISFCDSNVVNHKGSVHYKIVLNLSNRIIASNEEQVNFEGFSLTLPIKGGSYTFVCPEKNLLYMLNGNSGKICIIDYFQKKVLTIADLPPQGLGFAVMNAGKPELFMNKSTKIISCHDGLTFAPKYNVIIPSGYVKDYKVKDNFLYILNIDNYAGSIRTYDLTTQTLLSDKLIYLSPDIISSNLYVTDSDELFVKCICQIYNSQNNIYFYKSICFKYNLLNHLPTDSVIISHPLLNSDTLSINNYRYIEPSPDGNFLTCNQNGDILDISTSSIYNIGSANNTSSSIVYSKTGNYVLVKPGYLNNTVSPPLLDIYLRQGFNFVKTIKSANPQMIPGTGSLYGDDFIDNDTLISYNIKSKSSNPPVSVLTVFLKKFN